MSSQTSGLGPEDDTAADSATDGKAESLEGRATDIEANGVTRDASSTPSQENARVVLSDAQLEEASLDQLRTLWRKQNIYVSALESRTVSFEGECAVLKETEEKLKTQIAELALRERVLMRRLAAKEQDVQEYAGQLSEMKVPGGGALKNTLLDPAVNVLVQRLRQELAETKTRLDDTQNELSAWKFTPDSNTGKRLMAKCRLLYQENEELGAMISKGRLAKLEGDLALQKSFSEEVKKSQSELDELLQDLDEDVEGMQSTIYFLQQELRKAKESIANLQQENSILKRTESSEQHSPSQPSSADRALSPAATPTTVPVNGVSNVHPTKWCSDSVDSPSNDLVVGGSKPSSPSRTKANNDSDSVVNNNVVDGPQKRTSSESSGEAPVKKLRTDNSTSHYSDDELITNGSNDGQ